MATATSFASPQMNGDAPDPITAFARFKQKCQLMFSSVLDDADDEEKVSYILLWSGEKGLDIYNSWTFTKEEERKKPAIIFELFENQLEPKTSHRIHRYTLQGIRQEQSEPLDDFISRLKKPSSKMSISRQHRSRRQSSRSAYLGVKKPRCPEVPHRPRQIIDPCRRYRDCKKPRGDK